MKNLSTFFAFCLLLCKFSRCAAYTERNPDAKEDTAMKIQTANIGDVDDLIFQDCWFSSDR